jgi:C4-dicarboxylate-specific signal transduction histidine kinase
LPTLSKNQLIAALERENAELRVELEKARKLAYLGMMATTVAHEVSQPVHIIRATTSAALDDLKDNLFKPNEIKPVLERIHCQTTRLNKLIQNFRQLARSDNREAVNINQLLENTIATIPHKKVNILMILESAQSPLITYANPFQLQAVLSILLNNAFNALEGRKNATVWVKTFGTPSQKVGFSIEDNGAGLAPEYREFMFKPFVSTKAIEHGTGLGLYLAYKIIEELKGELCYKDRRDGGASFIITLPKG